jgi:WD40-like Beta Propeller Repeat
MNENIQNEPSGVRRKGRPPARLNLSHYHPMRPVLNKCAWSSRAIRVRQLMNWLCVLAISVLVGLQKVAARNAGKLNFASHAIAAETRPAESVEAELIRLQQQTGLSLASFGFGLKLVLFEKRTLIQVPTSIGSTIVRGTISRDGTEFIVSRFGPSASNTLELLRTDGSDLRELPFPHAGNVASHAQSLCWSSDKSRLAASVHRSSPELALEILNLGSGVDQTVDPNVKGLTSQCWSSDNTKIVYEAVDGVRTYEVENDKSSTLLAPGGKDPTWSPDGNWIAFRDGDTFYEIHPDGLYKRKLLHRRNVYSPLWWSPDSRFVAYVATAPFAVDDVYELRVRRLVDESEAEMAEGQISGNYQWLVSPNLVRQAGSQTKLH